MIVGLHDADNTGFPNLALMKLSAYHKAQGDTVRLIDADALTGYVTELYEYDLCHADADDYTEGRASAEHGILEKIRELPTIDAIPVEWLRSQLKNNPNDIEYAYDDICINELIDKWQKEQEAR